MGPSNENSWLAEAVVDFLRVRKPAARDKAGMPSCFLLLSHALKPSVQFLAWQNADRWLSVGIQSW